MTCPCPSPRWGSRGFQGWMGHGFGDPTLPTPRAWEEPLWLSGAELKPGLIEELEKEIQNLLTLPSPFCPERICWGQGVPAGLFQPLHQGGRAGVGECPGVWGSQGVPCGGGVGPVGKRGCMSAQCEEQYDASEFVRGLKGVLALRGQRAVAPRTQECWAAWCGCV